MGRVWQQQYSKFCKLFSIYVILEDVKRKSKESFKKEVKLKAKEFTLEMLLKKKEGHSKMDNLTYEELGIQKYFSMDNISTEEIHELFRFRTRMVKVGENYRGQGGRSWCPLCEQHLDNQAELFKCQVLKYKVSLDCEFQNLCTNNIETTFVKKARTHRRPSK